jgi:SHAQKYF class myb-like DNA-binding protein
MHIIDMETNANTAIPYYGVNGGSRSTRQRVMSLSGSKRKHDEAMVPDGQPPLAEYSEEGASNDAYSSEVDDDDDDDDGGGWTEQHHEQFVAAIFDIGLRQSSPSVIMENMNQRGKGFAMLTSERVKSKLQKYRNNKEKSKQEFMDEYASFLQRAKLMGGSRFTNPASLLHMMGPEGRTLLGGDVAGYLTFAASKGEDANKNNRQNAGNEGGVEGTSDGTVLSSQILQTGVLDFVNDFAGRSIPFPALTEAEKKSPLGASMTFVMGLFFSMQQQLVRDREARGESTRELKLSPAMEAAAATATSAGMAGPATVLETTAHVVAPVIATTTTSSTTATNRINSATGRVFAGTDFAVPSSAPQSQIYSAITTFLEREPSLNVSFGNGEVRTAHMHGNSKAM